MISGSHVALITPMHTDGSVDYDSLSKLIEFQIENGTDGIVSVGTTGESATLAPDEHMAVIRFTTEQIAGRCPIIAGTGSNSTAETLRYTLEAQAIGVDACLLCVPYYNKPNQEGIYQHYKYVADHSDVPLILYNVPGRTVADMQADTTARLAALDQVVAIKEANSIERIRGLIDRLEGKINVLSGDDPATVDTIAHGGHGVISVTANVAPAHVKKVCDLALNGQIDQARALDDSLSRLHELLFIEPSPSPTKWALSQMGYCSNGIRLPLLPMSDAYQTELHDKLNSLGLLS